MAKSKFMEHLNSLPKPWKFLAPMVGNSEEAYRSLSRKYGADLCYTEMVNCKVFNTNKCDPVANQWYTTSAEDRPLVIQICGDDPGIMLRTCLSLQSHCDAIDINFGCPQEVAKKGHYGSFLQDEWDLIERIVSECSKNIKVPLFCKIRVFASIDKSVEYAKLFERAGASLLAVHGRTREQRGQNTGLASWDHIRAIKSSVHIPVVANGNMIYHDDIYACYRYTNCDGVMIAEPHLFNPCIFTPDMKFSTDIFSEYLKIIDSTLELRSSRVPMGSVRSHAFKIFKSILIKMPGMREILGKCRSLADYREFVRMAEKCLEDGAITADDLKMLPYIRDCGLPESR